jgi:urease accessory protein
MGRKLAEVVQRVAGPSLLDGWLAAIRAGGTPGCHPIGLGIAAAHLGLSAREAFALHQYGVAATMLGAALRLLRIGHPDTQAILFEVAATTDDDFAAIEHAGLDDMHGFAPLAEVLAAHHVRAHVRMFMN